MQIDGDTLNINDELLHFKKKLIKKEKYKSSQKYMLNFVILNYKKYQFLMEIDDSEHKKAKDYFLELSDHMNQENSRAEQYITTKLHFTGDFRYSKSEMKKMIPEKFKRYFIDKIIEFKIMKYTEKSFRDPSVIPDVPDSEAMLYDYNIELNKGSDDGVFPEMKIYPQKDLSNCNYDFQFTKVHKNTSYGVLSTGSKCKLKNNYFSTVFRLQKL